MARAGEGVCGEDEGGVWGLREGWRGCAEGGGGEGDVIIVFGVREGLETETVGGEDSVAEGVVELLA